MARALAGLGRVCLRTGLLASLLLAIAAPGWSQTPADPAVRLLGGGQISYSVHDGASIQPFAADGIAPAPDLGARRGAGTGVGLALGLRNDWFLQLGAGTGHLNAQTARPQTSAGGWVLGLQSPTPPRAEVWVDLSPSGDPAGASASAWLTTGDRAGRPMSGGASTDIDMAGGGVGIDLSAFSPAAPLGNQQSLLAVSADGISLGMLALALDGGSAGAGAIAVAADGDGVWAFGLGGPGWVASQITVQEYSSQRSLDLSVGRGIHGLAGWSVTPRIGVAWQRSKREFDQTTSLALTPTTPFVPDIAARVQIAQFDRLRVGFDTAVASIGARRPLGSDWAVTVSMGVAAGWVHGSHVYGHAVSMPGGASITAHSPRARFAHEPYLGKAQIGLSRRIGCCASFAVGINLEHMSHAPGLRSDVGPVSGAQENMRFHANAQNAAHRPRTVAFDSTSTMGVHLGIVSQF